MAESAPAISLADVRLLRRLRTGEPAAVAELWGAWRGKLWAVCQAMAPERADAVALLASLYGQLPAAARGWREDRPICCLLAGWMLPLIARALELPPVSGIHSPPPARVQRVGAAALPARLAALPPALRLVYLVDLMFCCPAATTAELSGLAEDQVRAARSAAAWSLVAAPAAGEAP